MKLHIRNLGRIEEAEIDWRPLTVFVGETNTNKTWTAYAAYALARYATREFLGGVAPYSAVLASQIGHAAEHVRAIVNDQLVKQRPAYDSMEQSPEVALLGEFDLDELHRRFPLDRWQVRIDGPTFADLMGIDHQRADGCDVQLGLDDILVQSSNDGKIEFVYDSTQRGPNLVASYSWPGSRQRRRERVFLDPRADISERVTREVVRIALLGVFHEAIVLPAERKAAVALIDAIEDGSPLPFSQPVIDFIERMRAARRWDALARRHDVEQSLSQSTIEHGLRQILEGTVSFDPDDRKLQFERQGCRAIQLHGAASLVRSLAALAVTLGARSEERCLLVIDEPEMNAHPRAQCQIIELLAQLVNQGHYVLITTHSPYILDQLNNLVNAGTVPEERREKLAERFTLKTPDAFLDPEKVSVYHFRADGESSDAKVLVEDLYDRDENLIDADTFGNISEDLERTFLATVEANLNRE
ncbi:hypothetical protein Mal4_38070 [Maioricimonas rarisocia]|uniref:Endonuclease GajA/Old nuclease/RecF-like AAA domain-containing protein n=1 Tax=Maioricimonas rarisocia TaxID=2528026 RepID=A0A517ZAF0_9PLAN|nr:AAA family ATPase [Maioricimonas rarisocia]QDU39462.1 hypothetical protein Mal4_38070 [Maioricimonas rarisocia]